MSTKQYNPEGRRRMAFWLSDEVFGLARPCPHNDC